MGWTPPHLTNRRLCARMVIETKPFKKRGEVRPIAYKISVVERAIYSIGRDTAVPSKGDSFMLEKFLKTDF